MLSIRWVDVSKLVTELERCCQEVLASDEKFPRVEIVPDLIPEIHLGPPAPASTPRDASDD